MKKHGKWLISALVLAMLCLLSVCFAPALFRDETAGPLSPVTTSPVSGTAQAPSAPSDVQTLNCRYYVEKDFMASVSVAEKEYAAGSEDSDDGKGSGGNHANVAAGDIAGGIVPHHLLAGKLIATFFKTLSESRPETLIIVAPNHKRLGHNGLNTSLLDWSTPFGILKTDSEAVNKVVSGMNASLSNDLFEKEHSISSLVPYIKYYMPDVKIVPVLLHGNYTADNAQKLGKLLSTELTASKKTVLIASVDFSHYLDAATARQMDEKTLKAIRSFDFQGLSHMGNDNVDSPPSIITLLSAMKEAGASAPEVTAHGNSSDISGESYNYTTSYYTMFFKRPISPSPS